jgi:hypothetical protein
MEETVLIMDIDYLPRKWLPFYEETRRLLLEALGYKVTRFIVKPSNSKRGIHVWIHLEGKPLTEMELLKFQYIVGMDDPVRTKINYRRVWRGIRNFWNKCFNHKHKIKELPKHCLECRLRRYVAELEGEDEVWANTVTRQ